MYWYLFENLPVEYNCITNPPAPRGLLEVWQMLMDKTEEMSKQRLSVADMMLSKISEEMKQQKRFKEQAFKRVSFILYELITPDWKVLRS